jgi:aspartyl-tRNA(Asn)/glutamyl-tRNA(Gln) amidotransferase subunit B
MNYIADIGLEVHAEMLTRSKMFCGCAVVDTTLVEPNTAVCPICEGLPGTLPVVNQRAVEYALKVALALDCEIQPVSIFARKNTSIPTCPRDTRSHNMSSPWQLMADWWWIPPRVKRPSASAAYTWKRIPAS